MNLKECLSGKIDVRLKTLDLRHKIKRLIRKDQPFFVRSKLSNVKLHRFPKGDHECHKKNAAQFVKLVQDHLNNKSVKYSKERVNKLQALLLD